MNLAVVLHRPIYSRNIGMCARAIANMGGARLILIAPQNALTDEAKQGAAHAQEILRNAALYQSLEEFERVEGEGIRIALSGRAGVKGPENFSEVVAQMKSDLEHRAQDAGVTFYLHFGPEDDGLSDDEMKHAHHVAKLPTFGEITSLNISHAVLLSCYIVQSQFFTVTPPEIPSLKPIEYPSDTIHEWLSVLGFDLSKPKVNIEKTLNRLLLSRAPRPDELRILDSVLRQTIRKLRGSSR